MYDTIRFPGLNLAFSMQKSFDFPCIGGRCFSPDMNRFKHILDLEKGGKLAKKVKSNQEVIQIQGK